MVLGFVVPLLLIAGVAVNEFRALLEWLQFGVLGIVLGPVIFATAITSIDVLREAGRIKTIRRSKPARQITNPGLS